MVTVTSIYFAFDRHNTTSPIFVMPAVRIRLGLNGAFSCRNSPYQIPTIRVPPRAYKECSICKRVFVETLTADENTDPSRCRSCENRMKCNHCKKFRRKKNFSNPKSVQPFKTCITCRAKAIERTHQKRLQAQTAGPYMRI